jgi:serine/threonine-protein kinase
MPPQQIVEIITSVADALDYAHKQGLLHRDVKPANIMLV